MLLDDRGRGIVVVVEHLVLVAENVVVDVEVLGGLLNEDERLHELAHRFPVVRQLARHLKSESRLGGKNSIILSLTNKSIVIHFDNIT